MIIDGLDSGYAKVNGINMFYMYGGNNKKKPLLLIHGLFQTGMMWRRVVPKLMEDHYVIVPDVRGFGKTEKPSDVKYMD